MQAISQQLESARRGALIVSVPEDAVLIARGEDRLSWLNGLVTCDLAARIPGDAVYGLAVAQKGKIVTDLSVLVQPNELLVVVTAAMHEPLRTAFERYLIMEDVELSADSFAVYRAHGPCSGDVLCRAREAGAAGGVIDRTGLGGALIVVPHSSRQRVEDALRALLESDGTYCSGSLETEAALFIERGVPRFGIDFDQSTYPQEAGLEKVAVSFSKGCYLGQEVVCMLELRGHVKRKLVPLAFPDGETTLPSPGTSIETEDQQGVGEITSIAFDPLAGRGVALGMVKRAYTAEGQELRVSNQKVVVRAAAYERGA